MSPINPLDAPLPEDPAPPKQESICTPKQMQVFGKALLVIWPANTTMLAYLMNEDATITWREQIGWGLALQLGLLAMLIIMVALASIFTVKYQHLSYWARFSQSLVLFYLSVQIAFGLLLVIIVLASYF